MGPMQPNDRGLGPFDGFEKCEEYPEPLSRKKALKMYSKGDLIRYVRELEDRIERAQPKE